MKGYEKMNFRNVKEFSYKGKLYKSGSKENPLKKLALNIIRDYSHNYSMEDLLKNLDGVCNTPKGKPLLVKTQELVKNNDLKGWYFENENELIKIKNEHYSLYSWWNSSEIEKLIEITKIKVH